MKKVRPFRNTITWTLLLLNLIAIAGTVWSGYGGMANPESSPLSGLMCLAFPLWLIFDIIIIALDIWLRKRMLPLVFAGLIATAGPLMTYFPVNISHKTLTEEEQSRTFSILAYNVMNFSDNDSIYPESGNRTMDYILSTDATMIFLSEVVTNKVLKKYNITQAQLDSIKARYPYQNKGYDGLKFLSKYPFEEKIFPRDTDYRAEMSRYTVDIDGQKLIVYGVHLQSLGLKSDDQKLFRELTDMNIRKQEIKGVRSRLLSKFKYANVMRASQIRRLLDDMGTLDGNIIVCGDFNDVAGSYCHRLFTDAGFKDAYTETAFGPTITYHANHFLFHIDHVLYHGNITPVSTSRGNIKSSDHYPITATFIWDKQF